MNAILAASFRVVVMANKGRDILIDSYGADRDRIAVIPHGIPDARYERSERAKRQLGLADRQVILTFGLIGPNKGIEAMIEAMPAIVAAAPDALYVLMGATHPHLLRHAGESYRDALVARVHELGLEHHVLFINRFVDRPDLLEQIAACDIYVTPYPCVSQLTSGALAYSHGQGRAVVSTPYWHAAELLADGSGVLVPFGDPAALGRAVAALLADEPLRLAMAYQAYAASRPTVWAQSAARYVDCFHAACRQQRMGQPGPRDRAIAGQLPARPPRDCYA
jgi:glycosyltransferase involved in cell wall biosynthesis